MRNYIDLIEIMGYIVLTEAEGRTEYLLKTYGPRLEAKWNSSSEPTDIQKDINDQQDETVAGKIISYISYYDPTPKKLYTQWMVIRYLKNALRLEDLESVSANLQRFHDMKAHRQIPADKTDINVFKSAADLADVVRTTAVSLVAAEDSEEQTMLEQSEVLYNDQYIRILIPKTKAAACFFGRNTEWCTAWGNHIEFGLRHQGRNPTQTNRYDNYAQSGPLYIIDIKPLMSPHDKPIPGTERIYQYHSETAQFMDVNDRYLDINNVKHLLETYPMILKVIGEAKFAASHITQLGLRFFSPQSLAGVKPEILIKVIKSKEDFEYLPHSLQTDPKFLVEFLHYHTSFALRVIPQYSFTPKLAELVRKNAVNMVRTAEFWTIFDKFPMSEWSPEAITAATETGRLTYEQYMHLPADQRSDQQLKHLIAVTASKHPEKITTYPPGLIGRLGAGHLVVDRNPQAMDYMSPEDLTDQDLLDLAHDGEFTGYNDLLRLAYVAPERITPELIEAINSKKNPYDTKIEGGEAGQAELRRLWEHKLAAVDQSDKIPRMLEELPRRYRHDEDFLTDVFKIRAFDTRKGALSSKNFWMHGFITALEKAGLPLSKHLLEAYVAGAVIESERGYSATERDRATVYQMWKPMLTRFSPNQWSSQFIKTALTRGMLKSSDIPTDWVTSDVAARMFALDPTLTDLTNVATDDDLIKEINNYYSGNQPSLVTYIPKDRITEPIAYAAVVKGTVSNAKKVFPRKALSKRVYAAGVPWSFKLNEVPPKAKTDAVVVRAVQKNSDQLKYVPDTLEWLNAHRADLVSRHVSHGWEHAIERLGFVATRKKFEKIDDLPQDDLEGGYKLYKAEVATGHHRWFLKKGDKTVAIMIIRNRKLRMENFYPERDLEPVLREIATKYFGKVDITVLNAAGIYRGSDGSVKDRTETRNATEKVEIDGIEWTTTAHLKGKLVTAWKDDNPLLSMYIASGTGWGYHSYRTRDVKIMDRKVAMANAAALIPGIKRFSTYEDEGRWEFRDIGIGWDKHQGYWLMTEREVGKLGNFKVYYNPGHRFISIFSPQYLVAYGTLLKSGKLAREHVMGWRVKEDPLIKQTPDLLQKTLEAMAQKVSGK